MPPRLSRQHWDPDWHWSSHMHIPASGVSLHLCIRGLKPRARSAQYTDNSPLNIDRRKQYKLASTLVSHHHSLSISLHVPHHMPYVPLRISHTTVLPPHPYPNLLHTKKTVAERLADLLLHRFGSSRLPPSGLPPVHWQLVVVLLLSTSSIAQNLYRILILVINEWAAS